MADVATSTGLAPDAARAPARPARRLSPGLFAWALIAPALLFIGVIVAWPLAETVRLSFTDADMGGEEWVGLANYRELWESSKFWGIVGRTFLWMVLSVGLKILMGLIGATLHPGPAIRLDGDPPEAAIGWTGPALGAHTRYVLDTLLAAAPPR